MPHCRPAEVRAFEVGLPEVGLFQVDPAEVRRPEAGPAEVRPAEVQARPTVTPSWIGLLGPVRPRPRRGTR